jgi:GNAT superfamily N-acetyltransferase
LPGVDAEPVALDAIGELREEYRRELACQIVHDSWHERGFVQSYLLRVDGEVAGYGSVGGAPRDPRDTVKELYVVPRLRGHTPALFEHLVGVSGARTIEAQTNDPLLVSTLFDCAVDVTSTTILFADALTTAHALPAASVRPLSAGERDTVFAHEREPVGEYAVELSGVVVATGGYALHYNPPYADLYFEVDAPHRRHGVGAYLVQELKRLCRADGRIPAARCDAANAASRRTLQRGGMLPCARIVRGTIAAPGLRVRGVRLRA